MEEMKCFVSESVKHALYWKTAKVSNMEKAIGWH